MDRAEILRTLEALARRLHARGVTGEMYVVGGAAMALAYSERRSTRDVDAIFEPKMAIYAAADEVADEAGLPRGWLNDAVKGFLVPDDESAPVLDIPGLRCLVASPRILLALKVLAHRVGEDEEDMRALAAVLGIAGAEEVLDVASSVFASVSTRPRNSS